MLVVWGTDLYDEFGGVIPAGLACVCLILRDLKTQQWGNLSPN